VSALLDRIDRLAARAPWWAWPAALLALGVASLVTSLVFEPDPDGFTYVFGRRFGSGCAFLELTGVPCPQCGMTRSFVWAARGAFGVAWAHNPAGLALFLWLQAGGVVGLARLVRRDPRALSLPWQLLVGWCAFWGVGLYTVPWILRLLGVHPLP